MSTATTSLPVNDTPFDRLYSTDYVAMVWGVSKITVKRLIASKTIKSNLIGGSRRIPHSEVERGIREPLTIKKK